MLGTAWMDEATYLKPPLSLLHAALSGRVTQSAQDPSCRKLLRWQLEHRDEKSDDQQMWPDELHSTWVDELSMAAEAPAAEYGDYDGTDDTETDELVRRFLSGGPQIGRTTATTTTMTTTATTTSSPLELAGGSGDWSRNSLHACARFRTAAASGRSDEEGHEPEKARFRTAAHGGRSEGEEGESGNAEDDDDADDEAKAAERVSHGAKGSPVHPLLPLFIPPHTLTNQNPPSTDTPPAHRQSHHDPYPIESPFHANPAPAADTGKGVEVEVKEV